MAGVNLTGFFWLTQRVIAEMLKRNGGYIVNISAILADIFGAAVLDPTP
jgi:NADP-dependent 3-hydroxy acid dehydrogenase YdfG